MERDYRNKLIRIEETYQAKIENMKKRLRLNRGIEEDGEGNVGVFFRKNRNIISRKENRGRTKSWESTEGLSAKDVSIVKVNYREGKET